MIASTYNIGSSYAFLPKKLRDLLKKGFKGKKIKVILQRKKPIAYILYSVNGIECSIALIRQTASNSLRKPFEKLHGDAKEHLLKEVAKEGYIYFNYERIAKTDNSLVERLRKKGLITYNEKWAFKLTELGLKSVFRQNTQRIQKAKMREPIRKVCASKVKGKRPKRTPRRPK